MRIPEYKIEEIRAAADIVDVISDVVRLKKAGRNFVGLCPFHQEKTPSFNVNPERGIFKCFGCGRGGNVFTFLMEYEKVSFMEAARDLSERYGITLVQETPKQQESREHLDALYEVMKFAAKFFYETLGKEAGADGREYLVQRGWMDTTIRRFGIGYAPDSWDSLKNEATRQGFSEELLEEAGLIVIKEGGHSYDRFRARLIFPIINPMKKVVAFGARTLIAGEEPKYLNSPETPIYRKSKTVFGIPMAVRAIRAEDSVILVEGYADVLSMHQAGFENVVASSGTSLTSEQVQLLSRYTRNLYFLYDADSAGEKAMVRGLEVILEHDCDARVVLLPQKEDPDSFIQKFGVNEMRKRITAAQPLVDFITMQYKNEGKLDHPEGQVEAVRHIISLIARMDDPLKRDMYVRHIATKYHLSEKLLYDEMKRFRQHTKRQDVRRMDDEKQRATTAVTSIQAELPKLESTFLALLLTASPDVQREALQQIRLEYVRETRMQYLLHLILDQYEHVGEVRVPLLEAQLAEDVTMHGVLAELLMRRERISERWNEIQTVNEIDERRVVFDAYRKLVLQQVELQKQRLHDQLREVADTDASTDVAMRLNEALHCLKAVQRAESFHMLADLEHKHHAFFPL